jgi:hypothetical protein
MKGYMKEMSGMVPMGIGMGMDMKEYEYKK